METQESGRKIDGWRVKSVLTLRAEKSFLGIRYRGRDLKTDTPPRIRSWSPHYHCQWQHTEIRILPDHLDPARYSYLQHRSCNRFVLASGSGRRTALPDWSVSSPRSLLSRPSIHRPLATGASLPKDQGRGRSAQI
jgi:hypothetical protein